MVVVAVLTGATSATMPTTSAADVGGHAPRSVGRQVDAPGAPVTAAVASGQAVSAFAQATDGQLWWRQLTSAGWWAWQAFDGGVAGTPSVVSTSSGVHVFVRGRDGALYWQHFDGTRWSGWQSLGGALTTDPVAATDGTEIVVFARGTDGHVYWRRFSDGWSDWIGGGGQLASRVAAVSSGPSQFDVFVRGLDDGVWWQRVTAGSGGAWLPLGGRTVDDPAAAADSTGVSVAVRGGDNALYRQRFDGSWHGWENLGGGAQSAPSALGVGTAVDVFVQGLDSRPYVRQLASGGNTDWIPLGGIVSAPLSATFDSSGLTLFARGADAQLYVKTFVFGWSDWAPAGGVPLASPPVALSSAAISAAPAAPAAGFGFDTCQAPSTTAMGVWRGFSPFTSVGIYIGGVNRACRNSVLDTAGWVQTVAAQGWRLIPIYVGLQAPCISFGSAQFNRDFLGALTQGIQAADDAANRALGAGLSPGVPIYFDMEGYDSSDTECVGAVQTFISGWVSQLHARGFRAAMYSSLCSGIRDEAAVYDDPRLPRLDAVWIAAWNNIPNLDGFGPPCALSDSVWPYHQRIHQYQGGHDESYGGVTITIDRDAVDGPLAP
jgi:hypothetical protein